jgi:predicted outer membrane repeat protein
MSSTAMFRQRIAIGVLLMNVMLVGSHGNSILGDSERNHLLPQANIASALPGAPAWMGVATTLAAPAPQSTQRYVAATGTDTGDCSSSALACRTIIYTVAHSVSGDTINIGAGNYGESIAIGIGKDLILQGAGATSTIVDGSHQHGVFEILPGFTVHIAGLTIRNGQAFGGAGISNAGTLIVSSSVISGNIAIAGGAGGATGAGIYNAGTMTVRNSMISGNQAIGNNVVDSFGGGVHNDDNGTLTLIGSTVSGNQALGIGGGVGGGIGSSGTLIVSNSTFSGNTASGLGGGISSTNATLSNSTITNNTAGFSGGGAEVEGTFALKNTILAGNVDTNGAPDCEGTVMSQGYNLIGNNHGCTFAGTSTDQQGTAGSPIDPQLGPLQNNGGATLTHSPLPGSPAIDAGSPSAPGSGDACESSDQIGTSRPQGPRCDIGAVELGMSVSAPVLNSIAPASAKSGSAGFTLTVHGAHFTNGAIVRWNGANRPTTFVSSTELTAVIEASDIRRAGTASVTVATPAPLGGESGAQSFTITPSPIYIPVVVRTIPPSCDAYEPNDDRKVNPSGPLVSGTLYHARLCANDPEDNYYFDTPTKATISIALSIPQRLVQHIAIGIYAQKALAQPLDGKGCFVDSIQSNQFTSSCSLPAGGRYVLRLYTTESAFDDANDYVLQVSY